MQPDFNAGELIANSRDGVRVTASEAMAELQRVIGSPDFDASRRNRRFLKMIVESTVQGRRITGRDVAIEAFGRPENFDPSKDPIVRIECSKLRKSLEMYYLKSGRRNPLQLTVPHGSYRAVFHRNAAGEDGSAQHGPSIDADLAVLLRGCLVGWANERDDAPRAWQELQRAFPGFPDHAGALRHLENACGQDTALRDLLREGLRRLERCANGAPETLAAAS